MEVFYQAAVAPHGVLEWKAKTPDMEIISVDADGLLTRIDCVRVIYDQLPVQLDENDEPVKYWPEYLKIQRQPDLSIEIIIGEHMRCAYREDGKVKGDLEVWLLFEALQPFYL